MPAYTWGDRGAAGAAARGAAAGAGMAVAYAGRALGVPDDARLRFRANRPKARPATAITIVMMVLESMVHPPVIVPVCGTLGVRSEEHTSELQSRFDLVCRLLLEKKKITSNYSP